MVFLSFLSIPFCFSFLLEDHDIHFINFLYSVSFSLLLSCIVFINNKKLRKIVYLFIYVFFIIYSYVQYFNYLGLNNYFSLFDIYNAQEAFQFIEIIYYGLNFQFFFVLFIFVVLGYLTWKCLFQPQVKTNKKSLYCVLISSMCCYLVSYGMLLIQHNMLYQETTYSERYFYNYQTDFEKINNFTDKKANMELLHLYYYFQRDSINFISNQFGLDYDSLVIEEYIKLSDKDHVLNQFTGDFENENLILILLESMDTWIINEENTPTISMMMNSGINFTNHYALNYNGPRTLNTEYTVNTGYYIPRNYSVYESISNNYKNTLPNLFNDAGYKTTSIHSNRGNFFARDEFHESWGYNESYFLLDMFENLDVLNDTYLNNDDIFDLYVDKNEKFMSYVISYSAHGGYVDNSICEEACLVTEESCYSYLASITDMFINNLITDLTDSGLLDNTTLVLFGDHYVYTYKDKEFVYKSKGVESTDYELERVPFIIWNNRMSEPLVINDFTDSSDILPTIANMFGLNYNPDIYLGDDIFSNSFKSYLYLPNETLIGSETYYELGAMSLKYNDAIVKSDYFNKDK